MNDVDLFSNRCPSCGNTIDTPAQAAAHVCPTDQNRQDPTPEQVALAARQTREKAALRAALLPTQAALQADARLIAQTVVDCWDREVECIVILVPKGTLDNLAVCRFLHGEHRERQRQIFQRVLARAASSSRKMNGS